MGKTVLRKDKTCLNCRYVVENRFCPNCGQENTDIRKTFYHLFIHFFEDLTHYENAFWKTIKNLLFKPATLTKEYLSGKRLSYLAPVRLYIFISFVTFFLITVFPNEKSSLVNINEKEPITNPINDSLKNQNKTSDNILNAEVSTKKKDSIKNNIAKTGKKEEFLNFGYKSVQELDSIQQHAPESEKLSDFSYLINRKFQEVKDKNKEELFEKFTESFINNFSKVLFIYMPLFAFFLWVFHNKKRWYYFDHGIFTLHYFSFLLLVFLILFLFTKILPLFGDSNGIDFIIGVLNFVGISWMLYYFFPAHHRFYGETRTVSFIKSILLFFINFIMLIIILTLFAIYTFINLH
ncbi:DUF3667 domain-containing protein [Flavobacterium gawalongense]|uniref:DUF3667 domain-containing protein n=1 Tax=Flavobacterium gawalongense TaxID=2594432 RepID=A0ABY3CJR4_9FLAO|nr:DUF3667 domain-containing protein [Flavobacterium gawalongense]TRX00286.1 DUF3667 domain-containing protein [Flavobacterium gawalongense]TRX05403.1 DUF3667 domain-containing protein [Flavobacterium gawalongense]